MWSFTSLAVVAVLCASALGCATQGPQPTEELTQARTLVQEAGKAQAERYAAPDLQRARDELSSAELANTKGDYDVARSYAESAAVDADVANARASAGEALRAAHEADQANHALQRETERAAQGSAGPEPSPSELRSYPQATPATPAPAPESSPPEPQTNPQ